MKSVIIYFFLGVSLFVLNSCKKPLPNDPQDPPKEEVKRDFIWTIDTLVYDASGFQPDQIMMNTLWGSSPNDVYAMGHSDMNQGSFWHYDGKKWKLEGKWPRSGFDKTGVDYINYILGLTGFDKNNVFISCVRYYENHPDSALVLRFNGSNWQEVPWENKRIVGGVAGLVKQNRDKFWGASTSGLVKYENGILSLDTGYVPNILSHVFVAPLENGEVYINERRDSMSEGSLQGSITKLFKRSLSGKYSLLEEKFISGSYEDGNGLGLGLVSAENQLFTFNRGLWERVGNSWQLVLPNLIQHGGECLISENNMWFYYNCELFHYNGKDWKKINVPVLSNFPNSFLYGTGWSDGSEIFISLIDFNTSKTFILHGR